MKSIKRELNTLKHKMNMNQMRIMLADNFQENGILSSLNLSKQKLSKKQMNMNNSEIITCQQTSRSQKNNSVEHVSKELSLNSPSQSNKKQDSFTKDFFPFTNKNLKYRPMSSLPQSPKIKLINKTEKSPRQTNDIKKFINQSLDQSLTQFKKQDNSNLSHRIKTAQDKIPKSKKQKIQQDSTMYNFLQGQLGDLYADRQLSLNKPNMNLQQKSFVENSVSDFNDQSQEQTIKQKKEFKQKQIENEYLQEKRKQYEQNKQYFQKMYSLQKSALNQYLNGEGVEPKVIKCHKEIVDPLLAFIQQKQRENQQKHKQNLNKNFIQNNNKPIFESKVANSLSKSAVQIYQNKYNINNNQSPNTERRNQRKFGMKSIKQILQKQKQQKDIESNFEKFLKGEKNYFDKLDQLQKAGEQEFISEIHVSQKFYFDQQMKPEQQYLTKDDMKVEKNANVLNALLQKIQAQKQQLSKQNTNSSSPSFNYNFRL